MFSQFPSAAQARDYVDAQELGHPGAVLSGWVAPGAAETGRALFFSGKGTTTLIWDYDGRPYAGSASTSGPRTALETWWTDVGRSVASR